LWWHYPEIDDRPELLAEAIIRDYRTYDLDFVKMMPSGVYGVEDWGCRVGDPDPVIGFKRLQAGPIRGPEDWRTITPRGPDQGARARELRCLDLVRKALPEAVILQTIFSPLTTAAKLAGRELLLEHIRARESEVMPALEAIARTEETYINACLELGASGIFLATQFAGDNLLSATEHDRWCAPFEIQLLDSLRGRSEFSILHLHGQAISLDRFIGYPVAALSWEDESLTMLEGRRRFPVVVVGGLDRTGWIMSAPPEVVRAKTRALLEEMGPERFILAPGCVMALRTPSANLRAVREAVG
jgi:uroporphyrinogen decarboxylase